MKPVNRYLTRRHVQWLSILQPVLDQQLRDTYPDTACYELALLQIVALYNLEDQIANIESIASEKDDSPVTTSHLDQIFAIDQEVDFPTILREWLSAFCPMIAEEIEKGTGGPDQDDGLGLADKEKEDEESLYKFQCLILDAITDGEKRQAVIDYVEDNPDVIPQALEWLAFNIRRWVVKSWREYRKEQDNAR